MSATAQESHPVSHRDLLFWHDAGILSAPDLQKTGFVPDKFFGQLKKLCKILSNLDQSPHILFHNYLRV
jgi:hypothetical protein